MVIRRPDNYVGKVVMNKIVEGKKKNNGNPKRSEEIALRKT